MTLQPILDGEKEKGGANAVPAPRWSAKPEPSFTVSALSGDHRISRFAPTFVCRTHKTPHPRGHRQWLEVST